VRRAVQQCLSHDDLDNSEDTITSRFDRQASAVCDQLAIVTDEISLTYRALDLEASRIAAALTLLLPQRDQPIVLFIPDEVARVAAILGALKANRIFIPLSPTSPQAWLAQVIEDSGASQVIVDRSTSSVAAATDQVTVVEVDQLVQSSQAFVVDQTPSPDDT